MFRIFLDTFGLTPIFDSNWNLKLHTCSNMLNYAMGKPCKLISTLYIYGWEPMLMISIEDAVIHASEAKPSIIRQLKNCIRSKCLALEWIEYDFCFRYETRCWRHPPLHHQNYHRVLPQTLDNWWQRHIHLHLTCSTCTHISRFWNLKNTPVRHIHSTRA